MGTFLAVAVIFAILVVASRSLGYLRRGRLSVADAEIASTTGVGRSAAVGAGAGLLVLALMALLFFGVTRWDWLGRPAVSNPGEASPMPVVSSDSGVGVVSSPAPGTQAASPSASPSH